MSPTVTHRAGRVQHDNTAPAEAVGAADAPQPLYLRQRIGFTEFAFPYFPGSEVCRGVALGPGPWLLVIVAGIFLLGLLRLLWGEYDSIDSIASAAVGAAGAASAAAGKL